ncbi:hypothetical protein PHLCEN_2v11138 [Hermanssonia centrifuga]|uniref:Histone-lysine N-methyltransferase SET5 n=1 Tax=Hermanssonia centrifuga TaxID=98765 RepID=A0A2R6NKZ2_9APHY|nr:hypothetical protein PHLCEN_2v11138 [Hermanssonia centrifuga]
MALHALVQCTAKILLDEQQEQTAFDSDWEFVHSLAQLGMEDRARSGWLGNSEPDRATWKKAYEVYCQAFQNPTSEPDKNKLARILKRPIRKEVLDYLFNYDAFLRGLGRMSLNLEAHGGVYVLHSHMNHACTPNISVRHLDQRTSLSRINAIAKTDIQPGEELFITYVNPELSLEQRRQHLLEWGFGTCKCSRCVSEEQDATRTPAAKDPAADDLERELKAGLGVL